MLLSIDPLLQASVQYLPLSSDDKNRMINGGIESSQIILEKTVNADSPNIQIAAASDKSKQSVGNLQERMFGQDVNFKSPSPQKKHLKRKPGNSIDDKILICDLRSIPEELVGGYLQNLCEDLACLAVKRELTGE